ncbi:MAG: hypothetical protein PWR01_4732 [Clostridiales bacterium]|jgi:hypothetical protein|nr:hypothetical protein [Clostridiales bacterium]MDN5283659.1 hypothetical protein [Candidatus Ozemobacter sp.]
MLKSKEKTGFELAKCLIKFFEGRICNAEDFNNIYALVDKSMRRLVIKWGLKKVVSEEQIQNSVLDFMEELTASPGNSRYCGCLLSEITLGSKASFRFIHYYTQKRLFTILKKNADSLSSEYLKFDAQIKRNLRQLVLAGNIFFQSPDRYAADKPEVLPDIKKYQLEPVVLSRLPLKRVWKNNRILNRNLRPSLAILLSHPPHNEFRFKKKLISSTLFRLSDELIQMQLNSANSQACSNYEHSLSEEASEVFTGLIKNLKKIYTAQDFIFSAILLFALLYSDYPEYFAETLLAPAHLEILHEKNGKIDRIFAFLRVVVHENGLSKSKLGRTTVFNRLKNLKAIVRSSLNDCTVACRRRVILKLVRFLTRFYSEMEMKNAKS